MKKTLQNIALVAGLMGLVIAAYGPNAKARNYSGGVTWAQECLMVRSDGFWHGCTIEESREQYVAGSYREEVMYEPATVALHAEETREIAALGFTGARSWCIGVQMLNDFSFRLQRDTDGASWQYALDRAGSCDPADWMNPGGPLF